MKVGMVILARASYNTVETLATGRVARRWLRHVDYVSQGC